MTSLPAPPPPRSQEQTGPDVVRAVTQEEVSQEGLGGADVHTQRSGVAHAAFDGDLEALAAVRELYRRAFWSSGFWI